MNDFHPLSPAALRRIMAVRRIYFRPEFIGLNNLDLGRPALFVGNHTRYGLLDVPLMLEHLYVQHGLFLRSLGDRSHFSVPVWRDWLQRNGMVLGTPANCDTLMQAGASILAFPGGAREVWRRKHEQYSLIWKQRLGFVRQAVKHGYDIIPFASLGADECYRIFADADDVLRQPWLNRLITGTRLQEAMRGGDMLPPLGRGIGPTVLPRPQRFYFGFGARIPTAHLDGQIKDEAALWQLREQAAVSITRQLTHLKTVREQDRQESWSWLRRRLAPAMAG
jgi:hypothetical protein